MGASAPMVRLLPEEPTFVTYPKPFSAILLRGGRRTLERLLAFPAIGDHRRPDRIPSRQFHRPSSHRRSPAERAAIQRLLEDVLDRYSVGRNSVLAGIFPRPHRQT